MSQQAPKNTEEAIREKANWNQSSVSSIPRTHTCIVRKGVPPPKEMIPNWNSWVQVSPKNRYLIRIGISITLFWIIHVMAHLQHNELFKSQTQTMFRILAMCIFKNFYKSLQFFLIFMDTENGSFKTVVWCKPPNWSSTLQPLKWLKINLNRGRLSQRFQWESAETAPFLINCEKAVLPYRERNRGKVTKSFLD